MMKYGKVRDIKKHRQEMTWAGTETHKVFLHKSKKSENSTVALYQRRGVQKVT